jgi:hypothetical protein
VAEAAVVDGLEVRGAATLEQVVRYTIARSLRRQAPPD